MQLQDPIQQGFQKIKNSPSENKKPEGARRAHDPSHCSHLQRKLTTPSPKLLQVSTSLKGKKKRLKKNQSKACSFDKT